MSENDLMVFNTTTGEIATLEPGDILITHSSPHFPTGFIRRITRIETGTVWTSVQFVPAGIQDIISSGIIDFAFNIMKDQEIPITEFVLFDKDGNSETTYDQVVINGSLVLNASLHIYWDPWQRHMEATIYYEAQAQLNNLGGLTPEISLMNFM